MTHLTRSRAQTMPEKQPVDRLLVYLTMHNDGVDGPDAARTAR